MNDAVQIPLRARDGSIRAYALIEAADAARAARARLMPYAVEGKKKAASQRH